MPAANKDEKLDELRAQLEVAEHVASDVPEDASPEVKDAASKLKDDAEKALAQAHVENQKADDIAAMEKRVRSLQEFVQAGSTQSVRGTDALTPEEHALRRNPDRT